MTDHICRVFAIVCGIACGYVMGCGDSPAQVETPEPEAVASDSVLPEGTEILAGWFNAKGERVEKRSAAQWFVIKRPGIEIEIAPDGDKVMFVSRSVDGSLPQKLMFSGASNQAWLEVKP